MKKLTFLVIILGTLLSTAYARKPAVLDFVGIEHESFGKRVPTNAQISYNLSTRDFSKYRVTQIPKVEDAANSFSFSTVFTIFLLLCLPFASWVLIKVKMDNKELATKQVSLDIISKYKKIKSEDSDIDEDRMAS